MKRRWLGLRVDPLTGDVFTEERYSPVKPDGDEDDETEEGSEDNDEEGAEEVKQVLGEPDDVS